MRYVLMAAALVAAPVEAAMQHATGTFEVKMVPGEPDVVDGLTLGRYGVTKTFTGGLEGSGKGDMLTAGGTVPGSAAYVLIERVTGSVDGRSGSFALMHSATMTRGAPDMRIVVVPDSGTGALTGISGSLTIRIEGGTHHYDLGYALAPK